MIGCIIVFITSLLLLISGILVDKYLKCELGSILVFIGAIMFPLASILLIVCPYM